VIRTPHDPDAVKTALEQLAAANLAPLLVLGASAITDRHDVIPEAIRRAGGEIKHFGMPVDPGNLLLLGAIDQTPVIGLPGCARSIVPSGFDRVLERIAAGLEVTREDVMRMGAGGLMKDTDARLYPRDAQPPERAQKIAAVVLAAGQSKRMGPNNKLLSIVEGEPMIRRVVKMLKQTRVDRILVVLGHEAERVREAIADPALPTIENAAYAEGLSTSIRAGAQAVGGDVDAVLFVLGDMPWVRAEHVESLVEAFNPREGRAICIPVFEGRRGNPVLWAARFLPEMQKLTGDVGARPLISAHGDQVYEVTVPDRGVHFDVDTPEALKELLTR
jgi:molybdenum cofactor cytidylyltransferase